SRVICEGLLAVGRERGDDALMGFAYYYLAEAYFVDNQYRPFISSLLLGLECQLQAPVPLLLAKSYNMLGISASYAGNPSMAMDHYLTALQYADQNGLSYAAAVANSNIGNIYRELGEPEAAVTYLKKALSCFEACSPTQDRHRNLSTTYSSLATCYLDAGDTDSAIAWFGQQDLRQGELHSDAHIAALSFEIQYFHTLGNYAQRDVAIGSMLSTVENTASLMGVYDDLFSLCGFLYKIGYFDELWRLLCRIDTLTVQSGITHMILKTLSYKIYYYQGKGMEEVYLSACAEYFALSKQLEEETQLSLKNDIRLREDLEK
ncbi:MAG: tetratricopeptide repeat protein, partial [Lawsonibacter sp.]